MTLTAHPADGYEFYMWQGDIDASLANSPTVTLSSDAPKSLAATFIEAPSGAVFYVAPTGSDDNDGTSWGTAFETVKHAIDTANLVDGPATFRVANGTYTENVQADITNAVTLISVESAADTTLRQTIGTRHSIIQLDHPGCLDYSVYPSSPAIDAGVANDNVRDLPGLARPSGAGIDIGAYEYDQSRFSTSFAVNETYALAGTPITCLSTTFASSAAGNLAYAWSVTNLTTGATFTGTEADFTLAGSSAGLYDVVLTVTDDGVNPAAVATFSPAEPVSRSVATMYVTPGNEANEQFPYDTPAKGAALLTTAYKHALDNTTLMLEPGSTRSPFSSSSARASNSSATARTVRLLSSRRPPRSASST